MSIKLSSLKSDTARETQGDWQDIPDFPGLRLKVRSLEYAPFRMARDLLIQTFARKYGRRPIPPEIQTKAFGKLYADHILLDWEGLDDDSKPPAPIKFTSEASHEYLTDPEYRKLVAAVEWAAGMLTEAEQDFVEEAVKNSAPPSATT
ncbi:MAG: hypothetical protein Q7N50_10875 [Armatimonadota bacterium]|nr:hypothetical protein [Armatimonadota bacterium]